MPRGQYKRTADVIEKNRESARKAHERLGKSYVEGVIEKRRETIREKGIVMGRRKSLQPVTKTCGHCGNAFEATTSYAIRKAKYCNQECYGASKRGVRPEIPMDILTASRPYRPRYHLRKPDTKEYRVYKNTVAKLSERTYVKHASKINPNSYPRTLCGVEGGWQLDHIHPLRKCFEEGWTPEQASHVSNLQILPWEDNLRKRDKVGCHQKDKVSEFPIER